MTNVVDEQVVVYDIEWLDEPSAIGDGRVEATVGPAGIQSAVLGIVALAAIGAALVLLVPWIAAGSDGLSSGLVPSDPPNPTSSTAPFDDVESSPDIGAALAALTELDLSRGYVESSADERGVDLFANFDDVAGVDGEFRLVYIGADGRPVVVDTGTGQILSIANEQPAATTEGLALLYDGRGTLGFDPADLDTAWRVSEDGWVVADGRGELSVVVADERGMSVGSFELGADQKRTPAPASSQLSVIPGVGAVAFPGRGGAFELGANRTRIAAATLMSVVDGHHLERRFVEGVVFDVVVDWATGEERFLDPELAELGGDTLLSPDGRWVFVTDGGEGTPFFYDTYTHALVVVEPRAGRETAIWAPDSSYLAMVDSSWGRIWIEYVDGRSGAIALDLLQIPGLAGTRLQIF